MIGSMFVGLLIGLLAGAITNRGERMGCFGKMILSKPKRYSDYPIDSWCHDFISHLLGKRKLGLTC